MSDMPAGYYLGKKDPNFADSFLGPGGVELLNFRRQPDLSFVRKPRVKRRKPGSFKRRRPILFERDGLVCHYCDIEVFIHSSQKLPDDAATVEHIVPIAHGGGHGFDNLVVACNKCNNDRGSDIVQICYCERCCSAYAKYLRR
jgi:hypothetical protein